MKRCASVRFDGVLGEGERAAFARAVASAGAHASSWAEAAGRSFVWLELDPTANFGAAAAAAETAGGHADEPPLAVLRVRPASAAGLGALERALGGDGRPAGVCDASARDGALDLSLDARTPPSFAVAVIDAVLGSTPRTIEPLLPLDDAALAAFASERLAEPGLDGARVLEAYL